ncbi:DUF1353 domain-containing protein [Rhodoferax sp. PAMC 29310]|uniref:DUF1353 domain-containing protein n=1 Tax=Rhodoferax sp. PAMC 29310 TaxID=2822760 RepID=UPI001B323DE2|nr:DUF1353 domain-containing protein [Rhodoferax sp. PAMC 29310]
MPSVEHGCLAISAMSRFTQVLLVSPMDDGDTWVVMRDFGYEVGAEDSVDVVDVAVGFMTDFASIPPFMQWWLPKWGKYGNAAVIHDYLYWDQMRPRRACDLVFLEAMGVMKVGAIRKRAIFWGVRTFGWWAWWRNQEDKACGFDRVLRQLTPKAGAESERPKALRQIARAVKRRM